MKILVYADEGNRSGKQLLKALSTVVSSKELDFCQTIDNLALKLRQPVLNDRITVLMACFREELLNFISLENYLQDKRIILILPDKKEETITIGHKLFPRFTCFIDDDFSAIQDIVKNMMENSNYNYA